MSSAQAKREAKRGGQRSSILNYNFKRKRLIVTNKVYGALELFYGIPAHAGQNRRHDGMPMQENLPRPPFTGGSKSKTKAGRLEKSPKCHFMAMCESADGN